MGIPEQLRAQEAALKFIDTEMSTADLVAIMLYSTVLQVKTDFTADRTQLKDIINSLPIGELSELADAADTATDDEEDTGAAFVADETSSTFTTPTASWRHRGCVEETVGIAGEEGSHLLRGRRRPGRGSTTRRNWRPPSTRPAKANVAIYPIDRAGLMADPPEGAPAKRPRAALASSTARYTIRSAPPSTIRRRRWPLASDTGGKAFLDSNELSLGIVQAQQEYRSYYVLGYYSTNLATDGKYRKITVKLNNNQSAKLEFRQDTTPTRCGANSTARIKSRSCKRP